MRYFVFGSNGMMGKYFCSLSSNVVPLTRKDYDIKDNDINKIINILKSHNIQEDDIIINFAGAVKQRKFSLSEYMYINSLFPHQLEQVSETLKCKFLHLTTDCVYDGKGAFCTEDDIHSCSDWYGNSKSLGEPENSCCIRTSIIGLGSKDNVSLLDWFNNCQDQQICGFVNHLWNGLTCLELSNVIKDICENNLLWKGCRHIFSERVSKYKLLKMYNEIFALNKNVVITASKFACDRTLSSIYHKSIDKTISQQLYELKQYHDKYAA